MIRRPRVKASVNLKRKLPNPSTKDQISKKKLCVDVPIEPSKISLDSKIEEENIKGLKTLPKSPIKNDTNVIQHCNGVEKNNHKTSATLIQSYDIVQINKSPVKNNIQDNHLESAFQFDNNSIHENFSKSPRSTTDLVDNAPSESFLKPETKTQSKDHAVEDCFKLPKPASSFKNAFAEDFFKSQNLSNNTLDAADTQLKSQINKSHVTSQAKPAARPRVKPVPSFSHRRNMVVPPVINSIRTDDSISGNADFVSTTLNRREPSCVVNKSSNVSQNLNSITKTYGRIRTDSNSSAFSDAHSAFHKSQKNEENRSNARRDFETRFSKGIPEKSLIKMADLIFYNPTTNPMEQNIHVTNVETNKTPEVKNIENVVKNEELNNNFTAPVPQLKLNAQGELVLDDKSLEIETTAEQEARKILANSSLIYVDENTGTNGFYKKQKRTKGWTPDETIKFYKCLQTIGTDFSLISQMFTNRSRRDLKLKFKKEEKFNLNLINKAILHPKMFNIEDLKKQFEEEETNEAEIEKVVEKKKPKKKRTNKTHAARILDMDVDIYEDEQEFAIAKVAAQRKLKSNKTKIRHKKSQENELRKCNDTQKVIKTAGKISEINMLATSKTLEQITLDTINTETDIDRNQLLNFDVDVNNCSSSLNSNEHFFNDNNTLDSVDNSNSNIDMSPRSSSYEPDIENIIAELSQGSLVLVSTLDQHNPHHVKNEIFLLNKSTGELSKQPLDIAPSVVESIVSLVT